MKNKPKQTDASPTLEPPTLDVAGPVLPVTQHRLRDDDTWHESSKNTGWGTYGQKWGGRGGATLGRLRR